MSKEKQVSLIIPYINDSQFYLGLRLSDGNRYAYSLPGGHGKPNETAAQTARRELNEETTLEIVPDTLTKLNQISNPDDNCIIYLFSARVTGTPDGSKDPDQEFKKFKVVDFSGGIPIDLIPHLHGPKDPQNNLLVRHFGIKDLNKTDRLKGGRADKLKPENFAPNSLAMGIEHEQEHTKDAGLTQEIAMDHLSEDPDYYIKLRSMEKALKDVPKGKETKPASPAVVPNVPEKAFDYSHALTPEHVKAGYNLQVKELPSQPGFHTAILSHGGKIAGTVSAFRNPQGALEPHAYISPEHQGKGLGKAAYTALFAHALHNGHFKVQGGIHSDQAHYIHKHLAKQHGLSFRYLPEPGPLALADYPHPSYETELK